MLHGVGASMIFGTGIAILTTSFPKEQRGKVLGFNVSFVYLGLMLGPVIGGFLTRTFGWRALFLFNVPVGIAILAIVKVFLHREWTEKQSGEFDRWGALLYALTLAPLLVGFSRLNEWYGVLLVAAGCLSGVVFFLVESKASTPIVPVSYFRKNRVFAFSNMAALLNYSATYAIVFLMSFYLQYIKGFTPDRAGLLMIVQPVIMVVLSPLAGRLSDHIEPRIPASIGMGCTVLGLAFLTRMDGSTPLLIIIVNMLVIGCGFALFSSPNMSAVMGSVEKTRYGLASATVGTMRLLGQVFSMGLTMLFISAIIGPGKITPERYPLFLIMMHRLTAVLAGICILGILFSLTRGNVRRSNA
jgi:MFS family permease